jgi:hypothetical protein
MAAVLMSMVIGTLAEMISYDEDDNVEGASYALSTPMAATTLNGAGRHISNDGVPRTSRARTTSIRTL